jgi:hypothetical protein
MLVFLKVQVEVQVAVQVYHQILLMVQVLKNSVLMQV